uniref:Uncharacterized protein n=2 Tax=Steinernema glaseri TaxID=37863 RepID=A0A1I8AGM9_9BILA
MPKAGIEPASPRPQRGVLTTILLGPMTRQRESSFAATLRKPFSMRNEPTLECPKAFYLLARTDSRVKGPGENEKCSSKMFPIWTPDQHLTLLFALFGDWRDPFGGTKSARSGDLMLFM